MRAIMATLFAAVVATLALAGCDTPDAPPGTPGSFHARMNGQVAASVGVVR